MASEAQVNANRRNAKKSTGPTTPQGKEVISKNALKHGLLSNSILIPGELPDVFATFAQETMAELDPQGPIEECMAERIVAYLWRLKRILNLESDLFSNRGFDGMDVFGQQGKPSISTKFERSESTFNTLIRYEVCLERMLNATIANLLSLQSTRRGRLTNGATTSGDNP